MCPYSSKAEEEQEFEELRRLDIRSVPQFHNWILQKYQQLQSTGAARLQANFDSFPTKLLLSKVHPWAHNLHLGEYLGHPENEEIIDVFLNCAFDFSPIADQPENDTDARFDNDDDENEAAVENEPLPGNEDNRRCMFILDSIRWYISMFKLPGEASKIDRVLYQWAQKYHQDNPGIFSTPDSVYILAFGILMLNTDLHNQNISKKMTVKQFQRNCGGLTNKEDLSDRLLAKIYFQISRSEFVLF